MKKPAEFKVLLVYPNLTMMLVPSLCMALFTGILRRAGYNVELFDSTHYASDLTSSPENRVKFLQYRPFDAEKDLDFKIQTDLMGDFARKVADYKPDLMIVSVVEDTFLQAISLLEAVKDSEIPSILGGVFITAAPDTAISFPQVKMIGLGEGEDTILPVAERIRRGESCEDLHNVWVKRPDGSIAKNAMRPLVDISGSAPDFSLFDEARFYRPMGGRVFKTLPVETYRGCPYSCTFCNSPMQVETMRSNHLGNFMRRKGPESIRRDILSLIEKHDPEYLFFIDDSFLARPEEEINAFIEMYREFKLPFWCNTRPEDATVDRLAGMKSVGCDRISFGLECGNEEFRQKVVQRAPTNQEILGYFETIARSGIAFSINNIIGFPDETRDMVFETIELNRRFSGYDAMTVSIFTPYHGTKMREMAIERSYLDASVITTHTTSNSLLTMPQFTSQDIDGLMRTFMLYVRFPKEEWPRIRLAEQDTEEGNRIFEEYQEKYRNKFFSGTQDEKASDWDGPTEYAVPPQENKSRSEESWGWNCGSEQREYVVPRGATVARRGGSNVS